MTRRAASFGAVALALLLVACNRSDSSRAESEYGEKSGGDCTVYSTDGGAYSQPAPDLNAATRADHESGEAIFNATASGFGPLYIHAGCDSCHFRAGRSFAGLGLLRLSEPGVEADGSPVAATGFGLQLQTLATGAASPEGTLSVSYVDDISGSYGDGEPFTLQRPAVSIDSPYTTLPDPLLQSLRAAPAVFGSGLLEALDDATILAAADESDTNADGISGRANYVRDAVTAELRLSRFGWKAEQPDVRQQVAAALHQDMGVTTTVFSTEVAAGQPQDDGLSDEPEVADAQLDLLVQFIRTLAVPARREPNDPVTLRGEQLFRDAGCASCHRPTMRTGNSHPIAALRNQTIHPFSDLLLHDMGDDLADDRPVFVANGHEWRTPPLWGLGLRNVVNAGTRLLHDGRARTVAEAILWHGGEAQDAREFFRTLPADDRAALLQFVESN